MAEIETDALEQARSWLAEHRQQLRDASIKEIHVEYSGSGDEGSVEEIRCYSVEDADRWSAEETLVECDRANISLAPLEVLEPLYYADGDGGSGVVKLQIETGKIILCHSVVVSETVALAPVEY